MKKKNGFISMSIIYSFFAVFAIVSTSLLLIYSNNIAIVKSINKEVKQGLNKKGNDLLLVFDNLIVDGSIESPSTNWVSIGSNVNGYGNPVSNSVAKEQQYFGNYSMGMVTSSTNYYFLVRNKNTIKMYKDHYYYITRVYQSWNHTRGDMLQLYFMAKAKSSNFSASKSFDTVISTAGTGTKTYDIMTNARGYTSADVYTNVDISSSRNRRESGWCAGVNGREGSSGCTAGTYANTLESGIFKFTAADGDYYLVSGANFYNWSSKTNPFPGDGSGCTYLCGLAPRYYTDGYMLFDLTVAFQLTQAEADTALGTDANKRCKSKKIDDLLDARYIEGRKEFAAHRLNIKMSC